MLSSLEWHSYNKYSFKNERVSVQLRNTKLKKNTFHYNSSKYYSVNWNILIGKYSFVIVNLVETGILYLSYVAFPITFIQIKVDSRLYIV